MSIFAWVHKCLRTKPARLHRRLSVSCQSLEARIALSPTVSLDDSFISPEPQIQVGFPQQTGVLSDEATLPSGPVPPAERIRRSSSNNRIADEIIFSVLPGSTRQGRNSEGAMATSVIVDRASYDLSLDVYVLLSRSGFPGFDVPAESFTLNAGESTATWQLVLSEPSLSFDPDNIAITFVAFIIEPGAISHDELGVAIPSPSASSGTASTTVQDTQALGSSEANELYYLSLGIVRDAVLYGLPRSVIEVGVVSAVAWMCDARELALQRLQEVTEPTSFLLVLNLVTRPVIGQESPEAFGQPAVNGTPDPFHIVTLPASSVEGTSVEALRSDAPSSPPVTIHWATTFGQNALQGGRHEQNVRVPQMSLVWRDASAGAHTVGTEASTELLSKLVAGLSMDAPAGKTPRPRSTVMPRGSQVGSSGGRHELHANETALSVHIEMKVEADMILLAPAAAGGWLGFRMMLQVTPQNSEEMGDLNRGVLITGRRY